MTVKEIDIQLLAHESEIEKNCLELNALYNKLQASSIEFIKSEIQIMIQNYVKNNPEITKEIGLENLRNIKTEMNNIINEMDKLLPNCFLENKVNYHVNLQIKENGDMYGQEYNIQQNIKSSITTALRKLMGKAGEILIKYKYTKIDNNEWKKNNTTNEKVEYGYGLGYTTELEDVIIEYTKKCKEKFRHMLEIRKLKDQRSKQEAEDLWDQV